MLTTVLFGLLALSPQQEAQTPGAKPSETALAVEGFRHQPGLLKPGRVYHYQKSNVDGTRASLVDLYIATDERIESYKFSQGAPEATLVVADMDWETFSVKRFETSKRYPDGSKTLVAELEAQGTKLIGKAGGATFELELERLPWHSYDFDLASLNVAMRYLEDPEGKVTFGIVDLVRGKLANIGAVDLAFEASEEHAGTACRRYSIDGPGLHFRGGTIWVRRDEDPVIVDYEIDLPDEPGMTSGKMTLLGTSMLTAQEWEEHRANKLR